MPTASSYDGALLCVARQRVADLRNQLRTLSAAYASCVPGRDDGRMEELEHDMASLACRLEHEQAMLHELESAGERNWLQLDMADIPEALRSGRAMRLWRRLYKARLVDNRLQPMCSHRQAALIADEMSNQLGLKQRWIHFERLWNVHNLRNVCNRAYESPNNSSLRKPVTDALYGKDYE